MAKAQNPMASPIAVEVELRSERAAALRRVGAKLEKLIGELQALDRSLDQLPESARGARLENREKLRSEAELQRWYLIVQREAMGLTQHGDIDLQYPLPLRRKA
jgi:hypothetical protein